MSSMPPSQSANAVLIARLGDVEALRLRVGETEAAHAAARILRRIEQAVIQSGGRAGNLSPEISISVFTTMEQALRCAKEMQRRVGALPPVSGIHLRLCLGLAEGEIREVAEGWVGDAVERATKLSATADDGEIVTDPRSTQATTESARQQVMVAGNGIAHAAQDTAASARLVLRYRADTWVLDKRHATLRLGREGDNDVILDARRVSRHHAQIRLHHGRFVLVDHSTNGSAVIREGTSEVVARGGEIELLGSGTLRLPANTGPEDSERLDYEVFPSSAP